MLHGFALPTPRPHAHARPLPLPASTPIPPPQNPSLQDRFTGIAFHSSALYTHLGESNLAKELTEVAAKHPKVG